MRNYEDLQVWRKGHDLTQEIYKNTRSFPSHERFGLTSQIRRSCSSIGANLAEACGRRSDAEMARLFRSRWDRAQSFRIICDLPQSLELLSKASFDSLRSNLTEIMRMLSSLSQKLKPRVE